MHIALRIVLWTLAALAVLLAGLFLYLRNADLSIYESQIEGALSEAIGHKIDFDGLFELQFGSQTRLTAEDVVISNATWDTNPQLLTVGHISVTIDTWSLLSSPIIIYDLELRDTQFNVEKNSEGAANWDSEKVVEETAEPGEFDVNLIAFKEVRVQNFQLTYDDSERELPLNLKLDDLTISPDATDVLDLMLSGAINQYELTAGGKIGPWQNLIDGRNLTTDFEITLGQVRLDIQGSIADLAEMEDVQASLSLRGPAIDRIIGIFDLPEFAVGEFQLDGEVRKVGDDNVVGLSGNLGEIDISATGSVDSLLNMERANLEFSFSGPDTKHVAEVLGIAGAPDVPFDVSGDLEKDKLRFQFTDTHAILGDNQFNVDGWLDLSKTIPDGAVTFSASGPNISVVDPFVDIQGIPRDAFTISGHVEKSGRSARFDDVRANIGQIAITANGSLGPDGGDGTEIFASLSGPDISVIETMVGLADIPKKPFSVSAYLRPDPVGIKLDETKLVVGDNELELDGVISTLVGASGTNINVHGFGSELGSVSLLTGIPYMPRGAYDYTANLSIDDGSLAVEGFDITVVGAFASVSGEIDIGRSAGDFDLQISATSDDVSKLELFASLKELDGEALNVSGRIRNQADTISLTAVTADIGNLGIAVNGEIDLSDSTTKLTVGANAPDSELLERFLGGRSLPDGAVLLNGQFERGVDVFQFTDMTFRVGEFAANIDGILSQAPMSNNSDLTFSVAGPDMQLLGAIIGSDALPEKSFSFSGEINGIPSGFAIENIKANIGENNLSGGFTADLRDKPKVSGEISAEFLDISARLVKSESETPTTGPYVIPDDPLPLDWLNAFDANIRIQFGRIILTQLDVHDFLIGIDIENGALKADPISFAERDGKVSGHLHISPSNDAYELDTSVNIENIHVGIKAHKGADNSTLPPMNGKIDLRGEGNTPHELMANSNGLISLTQGAGQTSNETLSRLFGDLVTEILEAINPFKSSDAYNTLNCAFYDVTINNGLATINEFIMQTDRVTLAAEGSINFANEALKMSVSAKPRKGIGISVGGIANSFLNVRGTLKKPALGVDTVGSVTTGGAAIATAGLSLVAKGLWDRVQAEKNICERLDANAR